MNVGWHRLINHRYWRLSMSWTKPEFEVVELGMEVGAYAGNA
ncbi:MAG: pyrroloquinoline quinone precursor peptide PqqA [Gemmatimonadetes bacterium]|nr:MAG: pyrroloquinoline quinone precursor peptide PqqA [Gemmatimonadota bacterium]